MKKRFTYKVVFMSLVGILACILVALIWTHADKIDGIKPEIPQYDAEWRGHWDESVTVTNTD